MIRFGGKAWIAALAALTLLSAPAVAEPRHGLSLFGDLKYPANFTHFDYTNPDAPKGGTVKYSAIGTFDTLNPFTLKGVPASGVTLIFDTLMFPAYDEPGSEYGLVAESADIAPDKMSVVYTIRPQARFQDGSKITPEDVVWTFDTLKAKGHPRFRLYYADVLTAEKVGDRGVKFTFRTADNRELPTIVGEMPVLSKAYWEGRDFEKTTLDVPLGSGPYKIDNVDPGRSVTLTRDKNYWAQNLAVNRGRNNFDTIRYDYYRDASIALEAFKAGEYDIRQEYVSKNWATGYDSPALSDGLIKKEEIPNKVPQGMQGFGFNTRPGHHFEDPRVREALTYLFDFEWANKNLFYGAYTRSRSYFSNSELAATGKPSAEELKILEPFKGQIPDEVFEKEYDPPKTDGSGNIRDNIRAALKLLEQAGWTVKDGQLVNAKGEQFTFEFLLVQPEFERIVLPFAQNLARVGIKMNVRTIDPAQYENRMQNFDFDMAVVSIGESLSPGNEQREFWGSQAADQPGSKNTVGIKNPAVDALIEQVIFAKDREGLVAATRALDRVLLWNFYVVPQFTYPFSRYARWDRFSHAEPLPKYGRSGLPTLWWYDADKAGKIGKRS
jgi:microcin C transport system substrate-binding protein